MNQSSFAMSNKYWETKDRKWRKLILVLVLENNEIKLAREDAIYPNNHTQDNLFSYISINLDEDGQIGSVSLKHNLLPFLTSYARQEVLYT